MLEIKLYNIISAKGFPKENCTTNLLTYTQVLELQTNRTLNTVSDCDAYKYIYTYTQIKHIHVHWPQWLERERREPPSKARSSLAA